LAEESLLERTFGPDTTTVIDVAPWDVLPTDPDEYFAARSQNLRKSMRKAENRFSRLGIRHHQVGQEDLASALDDFVRLQQRRGDRQALLAEMRRLSHAIAAGVAAGEVEVDVLQSPDTIVAVWISFFHAGALRYYQSARLLDPDFRDAGSILLLEVVRRAIRQGCRELDLLRGAEPYKMRFVDRQRQIKRLHMAHGLAGQALLQALGAARTARAAGRRAWQRAAGFAG
jgi:CelD/BcsL family acetyltransferase involved in cellulose biosynthesis